uniref:RNase H type-1 domain-containing protein n=1 Tax=Aegilops tauschii subsp. strangulata TaxID=200361 RepID=A0A453D2U4_AEGTS
LTSKWALVANCWWRILIPVDIVSSSNGWSKINTDACSDPLTAQSCFGAIVRNSAGWPVLAAWTHCPVWKTAGSSASSSTKSQKSGASLNLPVSIRKSQVL